MNKMATMKTSKRGIKMKSSIGYIALVVTIFWNISSFGVAQQSGWPRGSLEDNVLVRSTPLLVDLDNDDRMEIILVHANDKLYVYNHDGTIYGTNWPVTLGYGDGSISSPAVGDVDGDGVPEIVVVGDNSSSKLATVKVYEAGGSLLISKALDFNTDASAKATACLFDCYRFDGSTQHSALEILLRDGDGRFHVLSWTGSTFDDKCADINDYKTLDTIYDKKLMARYGAQTISSSVAAESISSDTTRVVVGSTNEKIYFWDITSNTSSNWSISKQSISIDLSSDTRFYGSVLLSDLDGDGDKDIIAGSTDGYVFAYESDGNTSYSLAWSDVVSAQGVIASPAVADLNNDGSDEIIIGGNDGGLYVWESDGDLLSGWPRATLGHIFGSPVVAELDGAIGLEVIATSLDGGIYVWGNDGQLLSGWPKFMKSPIYASPAVGDIHNSGRLSIVTASSDGRLFVFDLPNKSLAPTAGWQQFRGGAARTGSQ